MSVCLAAMPLTAVDVWDSAVKIGLGALISALVTLITLRRSQNHEFKKELFARRLSRIETIVADVQNHYQNSMNAWAEFRALYFQLTPQAPLLIAPEKLENFRKIMEEGATCALRLHVSEGFSIMIGAPAVATQIEAYRVSTAEFEKNYLDPHKWPKPESLFAELKSISEKKDKVLEALSIEFSRT